MISSYFWLIWQRWTTLYRMGAQRYGLASLHWFSTVIRTLFFKNSSSKILHEKTYENNQALHMGPQLYYTRVILALERNKCLRKNKIDYILQRFRGVGKRALQKLKNGRVRYQLKIGFQLRTLKGETYVNFKNFMGPVFTPQKRYKCHFYSLAYFCQMCIVN